MPLFFESGSWDLAREAEFDQYQRGLSDESEDDFESFDPERYDWED